MKRWIITVLLLAGIGFVAYLSTVGCCRLMGWGRRPVTLSQRLNLTSSEHEEMVRLEQAFSRRQAQSCELLCAKRAQLIQLVQQDDPDAALIQRIVEEIGFEQMSMEKATAEHLLALRRSLDPDQRKQLSALIAEEPRTACSQTVCGRTPNCFAKRTGTL